MRESPGNESSNRHDDPPPAGSLPETGHALLPAKADVLQSRRLLDRLRCDVCRYKHYNLRTEKTDAGWVRRLGFSKQALRVDPRYFRDFTRTKSARHLPIVVTRPEAGVLINALLPPWRLMALLLYGAGLRLMECLWYVSHPRRAGTAWPSGWLHHDDIYTHVLNRPGMSIRSPADTS